MKIWEIAGKLLKFFAAERTKMRLKGDLIDNSIGR